MPAALDRIGALRDEPVGRGRSFIARTGRSLAAQRVVIAKIGGVAADAAMRLLQGWAAARGRVDPDEWSADPWPSGVRAQADAFADRLRAHSLSPPVVYFVEWSDPWSMGDLFPRWLTPPDGPPPVAVHADRFEIYGYPLPDDGRLDRHLATAGPQPFDEYDWFVGRLREAMEAWRGLAGRAAIVVLREVVGGLVTDEELEASLAVVPDWLAE